MSDRSDRPPLFTYDPSYGVVGVVLTAVIDALVIVAVLTILWR